MENAWDALRKGSALEVMGKTCVGRLLIGQTPGSDPALAGMRVPDLGAEFANPKKKRSAPAPSFRWKRESAGFTPSLEAFRHVAWPSLRPAQGRPGHAKVGTCKSSCHPLARAGNPVPQGMSWQFSALARGVGPVARKPVGACPFMIKNLTNEPSILLKTKRSVSGNPASR
jgi:hypothetical protein